MYGIQEVMGYQEYGLREVRLYVFESLMNLLVLKVFNLS